MCKLLPAINNPLPGTGAVDAERAGGSAAAIAALTAACIPASRLAGSADVVVGVVVVPGDAVLVEVADVGAVELGTVDISRQKKKRLQSGVSELHVPSPASHTSDMIRLCTRAVPLTAHVREARGRWCRSRCDPPQHVLCCHPPE